MIKKINCKFIEKDKFLPFEIDMIISKEFNISEILYRYIKSLSENKKKNEFRFTALKNYDEKISILKPLLKYSNIGIVEGPEDMWVKTNTNILFVSYYIIKVTPNLR